MANTMELSRTQRVENMMDYVEQQSLRSRMAKRDDNRRMFFRAETIDYLKDSDGNVFQELTVKSPKPLSLREVSEFIIDNEGKSDRIIVKTIH